MGHKKRRNRKRKKEAGESLGDAHGDVHNFFFFCLDVQTYVESKLRLARAGRDDAGFVAASLGDLCVRLDDAQAVSRALSLWRQQVIFFGL